MVEILILYSGKFKFENFFGVTIILKYTTQFPAFLHKVSRA